MGKEAGVSDALSIRVIPESDCRHGYSAMLRLVGSWQEKKPIDFPHILQI